MNSHRSIADDHAIVREGLRTLIASEPGMELVGEATDGAEAVAKALALQPRRDLDGPGHARQGWPRGHRRDPASES